MQQVFKILLSLGYLIKVYNFACKHVKLFETLCGDCSGSVKRKAVLYELQEHAPDVTEPVLRAVLEIAVIVCKRLPIK